MFRTLIAALLLGLAAPAFTCDVTAGPGKVFRASDGEVGGFVTAGCVFKRKYELRAFYFGEMRIYDEQLRIKPFFAVSVARLWMFREGKRFQPILGVGVILKKEERCHYDGDLACNRMLPLTYAFYPTLGARIGDVLVTIGHASNNSMDWGPEKKNLGLDSVRAEVWFK